MRSAFLAVEFFAPVVSSLLLLIGLYTDMMWRRAIPRKTVLLRARPCAILA